MLVAESGALSAHGFICEDGPELPEKEEQESAQEGGDVLEGIYAEGCQSIAQANISGKQESVQTPVPSDEDKEEMTFDQARLV
jgi:hypothetical protein